MTTATITTKLLPEVFLHLSLKLNYKKKSKCELHSGKHFSYSGAHFRSMPIYFRFMPILKFYFRFRIPLGISRKECWSCFLERSWIGNVHFRSFTSGPWKTTLISPPSFPPSFPTPPPLPFNLFLQFSFNEVSLNLNLDLSGKENRHVLKI